MEIVVRVSGRAKDVFPAIKQMAMIAGDKLTIGEIVRIKGGDKDETGNPAKTIS